MNALERNDVATNRPDSRLSIKTIDAFLSQHQVLKPKLAQAVNNIAQKLAVIPEVDWQNISFASMGKSRRLTELLMEPVLAKFEPDHPIGQAWRSRVRFNDQQNQMLYMPYFDEPVLKLMKDTFNVGQTVILTDDILLTGTKAAWTLDQLVTFDFDFRFIVVSALPSPGQLGWGTSNYQPELSENRDKFIIGLVDQELAEGLSQVSRTYSDSVRSRLEVIRSQRRNRIHTG